MASDAAMASESCRSSCAMDSFDGDGLTLAGLPKKDCKLFCPFTADFVCFLLLEDGNFGEGAGRFAGDASRGAGEGDGRDTEAAIGPAVIPSCCD